MWGKKRSTGSHVDYYFEPPECPGTVLRSVPQARLWNDTPVEQRHMNTAAVVGSTRDIVVEERWAQCEEPSCLKWRKIPAAVPDADIPEVFRCDMNRWDPFHSSCSVAEEIYDAAADPTAVAPSSSSKVKKEKMKAKAKKRAKKRAFAAPVDSTYTSAKADMILAALKARGVKQTDIARSNDLRDSVGLCNWLRGRCLHTESGTKAGAALAAWYNRTGHTSSTSASQPAVTLVETATDDGKACFACSECGHTLFQKAASEKHILAMPCRDPDWNAQEGRVRRKKVNGARMPSKPSSASTASAASAALNSAPPQQGRRRATAMPKADRSMKYEAYAANLMKDPGFTAQFAAGFNLGVHGATGRGGGGDWR